jgi:hypothetical protein
MIMPKFDIYSYFIFMTKPKQPFSDMNTIYKTVFPVIYDKIRYKFGRCVIKQFADLLCKLLS